MQLESFRGTELHKVIKQVRLSLGDDAMIVHTHVARGSQGNVVEVIAAHSDAVDAFKARLDGARAAAERAKRAQHGAFFEQAVAGASVCRSADSACTGNRAAALPRKSTDM